MRYAMQIEYDGTAYAGWQFQKNALTVQEVLERALFQLSGRHIGVTGASRTDAGVHAMGQIAHFDAQLAVPPEKLFLALNTILPPDVRVCRSAQAPDGFHARFDARGKWYTYTICNDCHAPALMRNFCAFVPAVLDVERMRHAAGLFVGKHDFSCAMAAGSQVKSTVRTIYSLDVVRRGAMIDLNVRGDGFLYNMVRILAGTLIRVGQAKLSEDEIAAAMQCGDRRLLGFTAPPQGLVLREVFYEKPPF